MARPKLSSPNQPLPVRIPLLLYEAFASVYLAVFLILTLAFVLAWATFLERDYGTESVHFAIYDAWWFSALLGLLGLNVLCAALIRYPWRRHQTGFLITHAGILVLLAGCIYSAVGGIDAQMPIFEGDTNHVAYEDTRHFQLKIYSDQSAGGSYSVMDVPFASGPFNWGDYERMGSFPWRFGHRDRGVICDQNGIRLEVLDYFRDCTRSAEKPLIIRASVSEPGSNQPASFDDVQLSNVRHDQQTGELHVVGASEKGPGDVRFVFWGASSRAETEAFRLAVPQGDLGESGQIVLYARGEVFRYNADELKPGDRKTLGDTGYEAEFVRLSPELLGAELRIHPPHGEPQRMILLAEAPEFNAQARDHGIYGSYWVDADSPSARNMANSTELDLNAVTPRVDVIQDADMNLLYRVWQSPQVGDVEELPVGRHVHLALTRSNRAMEFYVDSFTPRVEPGVRFSPEPFNKDSRMVRSQALVQFTIDGKSERFWLEARNSGQMDLSPTDAERRIVVGDGRRVEVTLVQDSVDVGFDIYLVKFQRKLDPGSSVASHYSSLVDFVTVENDPNTREDVRKDTIEDDVLITLNEPITRTDQRTGRSFRIYQESFAGPYKPGEGVYDARLGGRLLHGETMPRDELFLSWLTVNYDPGRGLKYFGSMMIVAGIATMFYMRAYFFRRRSSGRGGSTG